MTEAVSLFAPRNSAFHRLHPITKLTLAGFLFVTGLAMPGVWSPYLVLVCLILPLSLWAKVASLLARRIFWIVLPFAASVFLIQGFLWQGGTGIFTIGPLSLKLEGVRFATTSTGRILVVVGSFMLLTLSTRPDELMIALSQRGFPGAVTYIVLATIQLVPRFQARAATILDAQQSRGLEVHGRISQRFRALIPLVIPLVLGSIVDVEQRAVALEARAFSRRGVKTSLLRLHDSNAQGLVRRVLVAGMLIAVVARLTAAVLL